MSRRQVSARVWLSLGLHHLPGRAKKPPCPVNNLHDSRLEFGPNLATCSVLFRPSVEETKHFFGQFWMRAPLLPVRPAARVHEPLQK